MSVVNLLTERRNLPAMGEILTTASPCFSSGVALAGTGCTNINSISWFAASKPVALPFVLNDPVTVFQLGWLNGTAAGGGIDIGIYDTSFNRLVSAGATTGTGNSLLQFVDVADTVLPRGRYYLVFVMDNTTANRITHWTTGWIAEADAFVGNLQSATSSYPLPDPLVGMTAVTTASSMPYLLIATRALV